MVHGMEKVHEDLRPLVKELEDFSSTDLPTCASTDFKVLKA